MSVVFSRADCIAAAVAAVTLVASGAAPAQTRPPQTLQETGLYADFATLRVDPGHLAFAPQYPLWTDGAAKRRWISLPPGTAIDASDPDAWVFPAGTRLWKEFSFAGQRVETRYMERKRDGQWLYAAYAWSPDGREATLAPERGKRNAYRARRRSAHTIPGVSDCKACHQGGRSEVLGFSALQLSPERDPNALHAEEASGVDLRRPDRARPAGRTSGVRSRHLGSQPDPPPSVPHSAICMAIAGTATTSTAR